MKILLWPFRAIWALWGLIVFAFYLLLVIPIYLIMFGLMGKKAHRPAHAISKAWASSILVVYGIDLKRIKKDKPPVWAKTYIFISNHNSLIDIPICATVTNNYFRFLAKEELTKIPLLGLVIKHLYITVARENIRNRGQSIARMKQALSERTSVWIYPEGTRNKTSRLLNDFHDGAFRLASESGVPIKILAIYDTKKLLPPGEMFQFRPGKIYYQWVSEITAPPDVEDKAAWLKKECHSRLYSALNDLKAIAEGR